MTRTKKSKTGCETNKQAKLAATVRSKTKNEASYKCKQTPEEKGTRRLQKATIAESRSDVSREQRLSVDTTEIVIVCSWHKKQTN